MLRFKEFILREDGDVTSGGDGSVGGLGFNSGTPAVKSSAIANYVARNTADSDQKNNILFQHLKKNAKEHNVVKFDSFVDDKTKK